MTACLRQSEDPLERGALRGVFVRAGLPLVTHE